MCYARALISLTVMIIVSVFFGQAETQLPEKLVIDASSKPQSRFFVPIFFADHTKLRKNSASDAAGDGVAARLYLEPRLHAGEVLGNIFSRTISFTGENIEVAVRRVSGTATYTVVESSPEKLVFSGRFLYDGKPEAQAKTEIRDHGRTVCYDGKCAAAIDASGLLYNPLNWGDPPVTFSQGKSWVVSIADPWELGPSGKQTVTVMSADPSNHSVTLKRDGTGEGFFADEKKQVSVIRDGKTYTADIVPGRSHWVGYTTFREGVVISDELLTVRSVTLTSKELGSVAALEREYILLNQMPTALPEPAK